VTRDQRFTGRPERDSETGDAKAIRLKLDELLRSVHVARTGLVWLEDLSDEDLCALALDFEKRCGRLAMRERKRDDTGSDSRPFITIGTTCAARTAEMKRLWRKYSLSIVLAALF
jgi:hypothetical protein